MRDENIYVAYQTKIGRYYPTSFEEAFILTNYNNCLLNTVLKEEKPQLYNKKIGTDQKNNRKYSYWWQVKLSDDKSQFSNNILYNLIVSYESCIPALPNYILKGLEYIEKSLSEDV